MPRTTADAVKAIIEVDDGVDLTPFIEGANRLVTDICAPHYDDDVLLEMIERWLSAHVYTIFSPLPLSEQAGQVQQTVESRVGLGLQGSEYGQFAMRLDTGGYLAALDNALNTVKKQLPGSGKKFGVTWLGTECD